MIKTTSFVRPGMTAIAAVIALSSTPLLAQDAAPQTATPPTATAPAQVTPPLVVPTVPAPASPSLIAPAPAPMIAVPQAATPAPAPVIAEEAPAAAPVARAEAPARAAPRQAATAPRQAAAAAPSVATPVDAEPAVTPAPAEIVAAPAPVDAAPVPTQPVPVTAEASGNGDALLLGGAGLAVLALGAAGFALARRRRRDETFGEEEPALVYEEPVAEQPVVEQPVAEPAHVEPVAPRPAFAFAPVPATDPTGEGRHVEAAYAGPSEANPFVSLKKRLKRARFLDMQEAQDSEAPVPQTAATPAFAAAPSRYEERRFDPAKRSQPMRPAFQY